jgi:uncharacterized membrane protein
MMRPMTVRGVLDRLAPEVVLTAESEGAMRDALRQLRTGSPWYLRVLMAIGAWIGTSFLLSFVVGLFALILDGEIEGAMLLFGLVLMGGAVALRRQVENDFLHQLALVVSFTGQGMFIGGVGATTEAIEPAALAGLVVCGVLIAVFPDRVHRFLSTCLAVVGLTTLMATAKIAGGSQVVAMGLMALTVGLWRAAPLEWRTEHHELVAPVTAGAIVSLFALLILSTFAGSIGVELTSLRALVQGAGTTAAAVVGLLWLVHEVMDEHEPGRFGIEAIAASAAIVLLAALTWRTPAITTTLLIIVLGFDRRSRTMIGLAIAFFLAFGALYYYNLSLTLLQKSGVLAGSGVLCLAVWGVLRRFAVPDEAEGAAS